MHGKEDRKLLTQRCSINVRSNKKDILEGFVTIEGACIRHRACASFGNELYDLWLDSARLRYEHEREKHCHQLASVEARLLLNLDRDEHAAELVARGLRGVSLIGTKAMWWPAISHVPRSFVRCLYVFGR